MTNVNADDFSAQELADLLNYFKRYRVQVQSRAGRFFTKL